MSPHVSIRRGLGPSDASTLQFLDLLLALQVHRETGRRVQFLVAASSMQRKWIGFFARLFWSSQSASLPCAASPLQLTLCPPVPVVRAQDLATPGTGLVTLSDDDPCLVLGTRTRFTQDFAPRAQLVLPRSVRSPSAEVADVLSDTRLRLKRELANDSGVATDAVRAALRELRAEGRDGLEFKRIPHVDQSETYEHVYAALNAGGCVAIFPEGLPLPCSFLLVLDR